MNTLRGYALRELIAGLLGLAVMPLVALGIAMRVVVRALVRMAVNR